MRFTPTALFLILITLLPTALGCLVLTGTLNFYNPNRLTLSLIDNGQTRCTYSGTYMNGQKYLNCIGGHAAWIEYLPQPNGVGTGTFAYAYGGNNFRFAITGRRNAAGTADVINVRNYC